MLRPLRALALLALAFLPACTSIPRARALAPLSAQLSIIDAAAHDYAQSPTLNARLMPPAHEPALAAETVKRLAQARDISVLRTALSDYLLSLAVLAAEPGASSAIAEQPTPAGANAAADPLSASLVNSGLISPSSATASSQLIMATQRAASAAFRASSVEQIALENHPNVAQVAGDLERLISINFKQSLSIEEACIDAWSSAADAGGPVATLTRERTGALKADVAARRARAEAAAAVLRRVVAAHASLLPLPHH